MTTDELGSLIVRLTGDATSYMKMCGDAAKAAQDTAKEVKKSADTLEALKGKLESVGSSFLKAAGVIGISAGFWQSFNSFSAMEKDIIRMNAAIEQNGGSIEELTARYKSFAGQIADATTIGRGQTMGLLRMAESQGFSGEKAEQMARQAIGLAGASDESADSMMRVVFALERGNVQMLRRIPQLRGIRSETELVSRAQALMQQGMKIQEQLANTTEGKITRLGNSMKGLTKEIGAVVADGIRPVVEWLQTAANWFNSLNPSIKRVIVVTLAVAGALVLIGPAIAAITPLIGPMLIGFKLVAALIGGIFTIAFIKFIAIGAIVVVAVIAIVKALGGFEKVWDYIKNAAQTAMIAIEFGLANIGTIAEFVWLTMRLKFMQAMGEIKHFFTNTIPELGSRFINHWQEVMTDFYNLSMTIGSNLATNIVSIISSIPDLITGATDWASVWRPLTDGFQSSISEFPNLTRREIDAVEEELNQEWQRQAIGLGQSFDQFRRQRLSQMNRAAADAGAQGEVIGDNLAHGVKHGTDKIESALSGSAEALSRIAAMRERIAGGGPASSSGRGLSSSGGTRGGSGGGSLLGNIDAAINRVWDGFTSAAVAAWEGVTQFASDTWDGIGNWASETWDNIGTTISQGWDNTVDYAFAKWDEIKQWAFNTFDEVDAQVAWIIDHWPEIAEQAWNDITTMAENAWQSVTDFWNSLPDNLSAIWTNIQNAASNIWPTIKTAAEGVWTNIQDFARRAWDQIVITVQEIIGRLTGSQTLQSVNRQVQGVQTNANDTLAGLQRQANQFLGDLSRRSPIQFDGLQIPGL